MANDKLFLIDGHALCYRAFYSGMELSTSKGQATNAVLGFVNILRKILKDYHPEYVAICFDSPKKTHRAEKYAEYKIQRPSMPDDLINQMGIIKEVVKAYNIATFEIGGYEADDIIATLAKQVSKKNIEAVIVSEDKDMYQLANGKIKFLHARQDQVIGYEELKEKLGFDPNLFADYVGLAGDKVDNIPGVEGIGGVNARHFINTYGSLENILAELQKLDSPKIKEKSILNQKEAAVLSKELAILETNVPIEYDLEILKTQVPNKNRLFELFKELEFKKLAKEFSSEDGDVMKIQSLKTEKDFNELISKIEKKGQFAFSYDADDEDDLLYSKTMFISLDERDVFSVLFKDLHAINSVFKDKEILKITHNLKEAFKVLSPYQISIEGKTFDVMLAGYLLNPAQSSSDVEDLIWNFSKESLSEKQKAAKAVLFLHRLYPLMLKELKEKSLLKLFEDIETPLAHVLFTMESQGVNLDLDLLKKLSQTCDKQIKTLSEKLYAQAGGEFNLNSPKQLSHVLFEKLKLPVIKKTKTGFSTNESVLTTLAKDHEYPVLILEYRQLAKLKSTYIDALPKLIDPKTGHVHAEFNQTGTETGRLSSRHPNLQNIPVRTELGRKIRRAIIPSDKDLLMIAADYSQIELRILAHLSGDKNLIEAFLTDQDIHEYTASLIFSQEEGKSESVTRNMRNMAKRVNFGIIYGMGSFSLAKDLNISPNEAQSFIDTYFLRYPQVKDFIDKTIEKCEEKGFVSTFLNRRRYIPEIHSANNSVQQFAQRQAVNTVVQGSAADLIKLAMVNIQKILVEKKLKSKMLITVHDELIFEVPQNEKELMLDLIREYMENPLKLSVPIKVDIKVGENWLDMERV